MPSAGAGWTVIWTGLAVLALCAHPRTRAIVRALFLFVLAFLAIGVLTIR